MTIDLSDYTTVAEREEALFERYPDARIQVELDEVRDEQGRITAWKAKATIWRSPEDPIPVIDYAVEPVPGKTPYTRDSEAMNASTSAVGRAIILAGFPSKKGASADEVQARGNGHEPKSPDGPIAPSEVVIHFGKNKGTKLGELTPRQLSWYATEWVVQENASEYDHLLKLSAAALHAGHDEPVHPDLAEIPF